MLKNKKAFKSNDLKAFCFVSGWQEAKQTPNKLYIKYLKHSIFIWLRFGQLFFYRFSP